MAISVNTDLVLDVLKAGNPQNIAAADAKLQSSAVNKIEIAAAGKKFAAELAAQTNKTSPLKDLSDMRRDFERPNPSQAYQEFESMVLQQFVQHMLPSDNSVIFGEGTAGNIWKSMLAQQLGDTIGKSGGIGIAKQMEAQSVALNAATAPASNIIHSQERDLLKSLTEDRKP